VPAKYSSLRDLSFKLCLDYRVRPSVFDTFIYTKGIHLAMQTNDEMLKLLELFTICFLKIGHVYSDSRIKDIINKYIEIFDRTIISLYKDILKCAGRK